ncbi:hypothetical protein DAD186_05050 [Dermabacter vaginalis]|uniref:Uncharacterized protein n=1 Tax=Dermabacter vaginalis TaxID=1630135 RepID=A0A1B0ZGL8_9MICO|nr:hypothetical protein DAD186_05050 [Dermabacter vaginalis]
MNREVRRCASNLRGRCDAHNRGNYEYRTSKSAGHEGGSS